MSPGILQLQSTGVQDIYLTKDPQINIFKYNYYRYVNFATESVSLPLNENPNFGKSFSCNIPKKGHLLSKLYLHLKLPPIVKKNGQYACWTDGLGYGIFEDAIELEIGGVVVDRLYPVFLDMWDELIYSPQDTARKSMILKSDTWRSTIRNAEIGNDLLIPLPFWFTKNLGSSLPLLSILKQDIKINFKLRRFDECINYDGDEPDPVKIVDASLFTEYIFLDDIILQTFLKERHQYIVDQVQFNGEEGISAGSTNFNSVLKFNNPVKELLLCAIDKTSLLTNNLFNYSRASDEEPLILEIGMLLDGKRRFDNFPEYYYRNVLPDTVHSYISTKYMYCIPFSKKPEDNQPTGSINMSRFNDVVIPLKMNSGNPESILHVYAISYNILTIDKGVLSFEFTV
jgi:hypothetical protein